MAPLPKTITLASASPRRQALLRALGVAFVVMPTDTDEARLDGESPADMANRLACDKVDAVGQTTGNIVVIGGDTLVVVDDDVLGKPVDDRDAWRMLRRLRARRHTVITGLCIHDVTSGRRCVEVVETPVLMRDYSDAEIADYLASGDHLDKAGAYAIQCSSFAPVRRVTFCHANVIGFPLCHVGRALRAMAIPVPVDPALACAFGAQNQCPWATGILAEEPHLR